MPRILRNMVGSFAAQHPSLQIIAELPDADELIAVARERQAEVVIMSASAASAKTVEEQILFELPRLCIVIVSEDAHTASLHRLEPKRLMIEDVSPDELMDAILGTGPYALSEGQP